MSLTINVITKAVNSAEYISVFSTLMKIFIEIKQASELFLCMPSLPNL